MSLNCCICETDRYERPFRVINGYPLIECINCGLIYLKELKIGDDFMEVAQVHLSGDDSQKVEYWSFPQLYDKHRKVFDHFFSKRFSHLKAFNPGLKNMLDLGCGYGFWMDFCKKQGLEVKGVDFSQEAVDHGRKNLGLDIDLAALENYNFTKAYDSIVMCDILEHLAEPNEFLQRIKNALPEEGILFVQVPSLLGFKIPRSHSFGLPYHIWQLSPKTLFRLLEKNGFEILNYWTGVLGVIGSYEKGGPSLTKRLLWKLSSSLKLGNRLKVIARKKR